MTTSMFRIFFSAAVFLGVVAGETLAEEPVFHNTHEQVIKELTRKPVRYRGLILKKDERRILVMEKSPEQKTRGLVIVEDNKKSRSSCDGYEIKHITVTNEQDVPTARLRIEFDRNSVVLRKSSFVLLGELGAALTSDALKDADLLVAGHTDSDGPEDYNLKLSFDRANAVCQYLAAQFHIPLSRLTIRGYGEAMPLRPNDGPKNKQGNRRVEIQVN